MGGPSSEPARFHHATRLCGGGAFRCMATRGLGAQSDRIRRVGLLMGIAESDPEGQARTSGRTFHWPAPRASACCIGLSAGDAAKAFSEDVRVTARSLADR